MRDVELASVALEINRQPIALSLVRLEPANLVAGVLIAVRASFPGPLGRVVRDLLGAAPEFPRQFDYRWNCAATFWME